MLHYGLCQFLLYVDDAIHYVLIKVNDAREMRLTDILMIGMILCVFMNFDVYLDCVICGYIHDECETMCFLIP